LTEAPLSEFGGVNGNWLNTQTYKSPSPSPPATVAAAAAASASGDGIANDPVASEPSPSEPQLSDAEIEAERKRAAAEVWWNEDSRGAAKPDIFVHDAETSALLELVQSLLDEEVEGVTLTAQQASVLRYLVVRPFAPAREMLQRLEADRSANPERAAEAFLAAMEPLVAHQLEVEANCRELQLEELAALQSIFGSSSASPASGSASRELCIYQTLPPTLKVVVVLQAIDCNVELGFVMPASYPLEEPLGVQTFVPPPFQGLKIRRDGKGAEMGAAASASASAGKGAKGAAAAASEMVCIDELLHSELLAARSELVGEQSVYSVIERAREFMEQHEALLRVSLQAREAEQRAASAAGRVLHHDAVKVFGRGDVEKLEFEAIALVQAECDLPESLARAKLKESKWDVQQCIAQFKAKTAPSALSSASSSALPGVMSPLVGVQQRQESFADRARFEAIQAAFAPYVADPELTLACAACCEDLQLREVAGQVCGHVMCVLCWRRMLATSVAQGEAFMRCVGYKCACAVEEGLIMALLSTADYQNYRRRLQDSFISLRGWRWCVNAQCDKVASLSVEHQRSAVVSCTCHSQYCFSCAREGHWPVSCSAAKQYESSKLVRDMRAKVQERIGAITREDENVIRVEVKKCPKCKTPWEKNEGCNHFKVRRTEKKRIRRRKDSGNKRRQSEAVSLHRYSLTFLVVLLLFVLRFQCQICSHHFCWICLNDWASHGVSWYQCVFSKSQEKKAERLMFTMDATLPGALDQLWAFCERELVHYIATVRAGRLQAEIDAMQSPATADAGGAVATSASAVSSNAQQFPPELPGLLAALDNPPLSDLASLFTFLREAHSILRSAYIFLTLHYALFDSSLHPTMRSQSANQLLMDLNQFEYFASSLDASLMPSSSDVRRSIRTVEQMQLTVTYVRKYAQAFAQTLSFFEQTELKNQDDEENTRVFFQALDVASTNRGK
jgi:ariadne-1